MFARRVIYVALGIGLAACNASRSSFVDGGGAVDGAPLVDGGLEQDEGAQVDAGAPERDGAPPDAGLVDVGPVDAAPPACSSACHEALLCVGATRAAGQDHVVTSSGAIDPGYIMDIAVIGDLVYTIVMSEAYDLDPDRVILTHRLTGREVARWDLGEERAAAITTNANARGGARADALFVMSRRDSAFIRAYDRCGQPSSTWPLEEEIAGKRYGLAYDGRAFYFASEVEDRSLIYRFDPSAEAGQRVTLFGEAAHKIYALTFAEGRLLAFQRAMDVYSEYWILAFDASGAVERKLHFLHDLTWGLDYDGGSLYGVKRAGEGQEIFSFDLLEEAGRVEARTMRKAVRVIFPFHNEADGAYDLDVWVPAPADWGVQALEAYQITPEPEEIVTDRYGNPWARVAYRGIDHDPEVTLSFRLKTEEITQTLEPGYRFDPEDFPAEILDTHAAPTACFDFEHALIQGMRGELEITGDYLADLLTIRDFVNDRLDVVGPSGPEARASDFLAQGVGRCYAHTLSFAAVARMFGYPVRAIGGIIADESHAEADPRVHTWNQFYWPGRGWIDIDVLGDDDPGGVHTHRYIGRHRSKYFYTFRGDYEEADRVEIFAERSWFITHRRASVDPGNPADVSRGIMRVEVEDL